MADIPIPLSVPNLKGRELELVTTAVETECRCLSKRHRWHPYSADGAGYHCR